MDRIINGKTLREILEDHKKWLDGDAAGQRADLSNADLSYAYLRYAHLRNARLRNADFTGADLSYANLRNADLRNADLRNAKLDYSCLPLWCGSKDMILCKSLQAQLLGHIIDACKDVKFTDEQLDFVYSNWKRANEFLGGRAK